MRRSFYQIDSTLGKRKSPKNLFSKRHYANSEEETVDFCENPNSIKSLKWKRETEIKFFQKYESSENLMHKEDLQFRKNEIFKRVKRISSSRRRFEKSKSSFKQKAKRDLSKDLKLKSKHLFYRLPLFAFKKAGRKSNKHRIQSLFQESWFTNSSRELVCREQK